MTEITEHLAEIRARVARATRAADRPPHSVTIVAVSKGHGAAAIAEAAAAGHRDFGESYAQEALPKIASLRELGLTWHFIGALQANKTRAVAEHFQWVHTLDRERIAVRLNEQRPFFAPPLNVLIQVNQAQEPQKAGVAPADIEALARVVLTQPRLALRGLMTIPLADASPAHTTTMFFELAATRARLARSGIELDTLSMGMSADFEEAVAAGSTCVRVGTAIFGPRAPRGQ